MSYSYNITFMLSPDMEERFLEWIRGEALPRLFNPESPACNPALRKVVEAGGERHDAGHVLSIALHAEFPGEDTAIKWNDIMLLPLLGDFQKNFGPHAAFFVTLLENIPL